MTTYKKERLPKEFLEEMKHILEDEYEEFLNTYENKKTNSLRVNTNKISVEDLNDIDFFDLDPNKNALEWSDISFYIDDETSDGGEEKNSFGKNPLHAAGAYYIQEPSAVSVVGKTSIDRGERILDLCAAPGGKSTYILTKLGGSGLLLSNEIDKSRVLSLGENLERFGAINSIITNTNSKELLKFFKGFFDKVFIDAPCSGQGMFRKDDFAIDDWSEKKVSECVFIQDELMQDGFQMLKHGGILIYSTCTFTERENEEVVNRFLEKNKHAKLLDQERIWPHKHKGEGHFCARIKKVGFEKILDDTSFDVASNSDEDLGCSKDIRFKKRSIKKSSKNFTKKNHKSALGYDEKKLFEEFSANFLKPNNKIDKYIKSEDIRYELKQKGSLLYLSPNLGFEITKNTLRQGMLLGEFKKNRFEPSHSLALALSSDDVKNFIDFKLDDELIYRYMAGESIDIGTDTSRGWILIGVEGISLGFAKEVNGVLKNKYPKGLRKNYR